jgi:putative toxin-antitoxin system antitoxin component (TIGR02293 family)
MVEASRVAEVLGVKATTLGDLSRAVERGLPKTSLRRTVDRVFRERGAATRFLVRIVPEATFKRRVRLTPAESERTERLARVIAAAEYVWGDDEDAQQWLRTPNPEIDGQPPIQAAMTELGARRVEDVLDRIFYGLPA